MSHASCGSCHGQQPTVLGDSHPPSAWRRVGPSPRARGGRPLPVSPAAGIFQFIIVLALLAVCQTAEAVNVKLPSLFRGIIVADSPVGVRIVSVETGSQAAQADLRTEDILVRIEGQEIRTIEEFAAISASLKGRILSTTVTVLRNGQPIELRLHLYSYPIAREWGIEFVPEHDIRYAVPTVGLEYWRRLGRGFEEAHRPTEALNAYLNALHQVPADLPTALKVVGLLSQRGQDELKAGHTRVAVKLLRQSVTMMQKLFEHPLDQAQLELVKAQLQGTVEALRTVSAAP